LDAAVSRATPAPRSALVDAQRDATLAQIAEVRAALDASDGGASSSNISPAMREHLGHGLPPDPIRQVVMGTRIPSALLTTSSWRVCLI